MKVLHICLCGPFSDGWSYQENLLAKYHAMLGHNVTVIASEWVMEHNGRIARSSKYDYVNEFSVRIIRIKSKYHTNVNSKLRIYTSMLDLLIEIKPDIVFIHGCQFFGIKEICKYLATNKAKVYIDSHTDYKNSASNWVSKNILHKLIWKHYANMILPYTEKFYGVLPARIEFLSQMYKIPREKIELLIMGADDDEVIRVKSDNSASSIREKHNIKENDFLIITGGKIDYNKPQTLLLMEAVKDLDRSNVQLIVFGSVSPEYKERFESLLSSNVKYAGWLNTKETYEYLNASDLVVFPGLHSVLWEQAAGLGKPCVFRYIEGFTHIDLGGNCRFIREDSKKEIESILLDIIENKETYESMKEISLSKGISTFSYKQIAIKSIS